MNAKQLALKNMETHLTTNVNHVALNMKTYLAKMRRPVKNGRTCSCVSTGAFSQRLHIVRGWT